MSLQFSDAYTTGFHGADGSANQLMFRAAIPFMMLERPNIFRITVPYNTSSLSGADGFGDITVFDLATFSYSWGRLGVGVVASLPTGTKGLSAEKWTAGPAVGFVNSSSKQFNWGLFAQTLFSYAGDANAPDVGIINLQPIFTYPLGRGRSLSLGNSALIYDTRKSRWASLLLGVNYGFIVPLAGQKWRPNFEVDYDFRDASGNQEWVIRAGITLLLPT